MNRLRLHHRAPLVYLVVAMAVALTPSVRAQTVAGEPSNKPAGAITGRVISSAGEPLAGASVSAFGVGTSARPAGTTADARGNFKLDGLAPGVYSLIAGMPGYVNPQLPSLNQAATYYHPGDSATLTLMKGAVITGTVTGPDGPLVAVGVFAMRVRDTEGKKLVASQGAYERHTDDRGVFRFYGLIPGSYLVYAARPRTGIIMPSAYDDNIPIFYPSSTRDTAAEILVRDGDEVTADLRYRAESGHAISGRINKVIEAGGPTFRNQINISIIDAHDRTLIAGFALDVPDFAFYGLPDGDYELTAGQYVQTTRDQLRSPPLRVTVRGADVTGLSLSLAPLASIDGRLVIESDPKFQCGKRRESAAQETMIWARRYEPQTRSSDANAGDPVSLSATNFATYAVSDAKGSFSWKNLLNGSYRIDPVAPANGWYVQSISKGPADTPATKAASYTIARDGISVRNGEHLTGLVVTITEGAAQVRGRVAVSEGQTLPPRPAVYLVPAEPNGSENVLRFYEARTDNDAAFILNNVAPGSYWIVARPFEESAPLARAKSISRDPVLRARVLQEAESQKKTLTLKPCEELKDFDLKYAIVSEARP